MPAIPAPSPPAVPNAKVLVVERRTDTARLLREMLGDRYCFSHFENGQQVLDRLNGNDEADLIVIGAGMPNPDGLDLCRQLSLRSDKGDIPIVLVAQDGMPNEEEALAAGAIDYLSGPFAASTVGNRFHRHIQLYRSMKALQKLEDLQDKDIRCRNEEMATTALELQRTREATVRAFSSLMEMRDCETGHHVSRTQHYIRELASELRTSPAFENQITDDYIDLLALSAPLHDVGKVAIPDRILLKPGALDAEEMIVMKTHTSHGRDAIAKAEATLGKPNSFLTCAREIAYHHHERWDGSGYPAGVSEEKIPLCARLMAFADVYDALISVRPYKKPYSHNDAIELIASGRSTQFDPRILDSFLAVAERFHEIAGRFRDTESVGA